MPDDSEAGVLPDRAPTEPSPAELSDRKTDRQWLKYGVLVFLVAIVLAVIVQWKTGAWRDDFSATGDEASHFTSAVAMSRYLVSGHWTRPYQFASQYYLHYPKVAFGKWPPVFYFLSGIWFLVFTPSRLDGMLFIALESGLLGLASFWVASRLLSPLLASLAAVAVVATPFFTLHSTIFMLEPQTATLGLVSLMAFLAVLEKPGWMPAVWFVLAAGACILTKANGWALLISAGLGYLWLRRETRASFVRVAAVLAVTAALCVPFYYYFVQAMSDGNAESHPSLSFTLAVVPVYLRDSMEGMGIAISALFLLRLFQCFRGQFGSPAQRPVVVLLIVWVAGPWIFQSIVPASFEVRHLAIAFPCVVLLAFSSLPQLAERYGRRIAAVAGAAVLLLTIPWTMPDRYSHLFQIAAPEIVSDLSRAPNKAILMSSNGPGEGRLVASMVALDPEARLFCIRATKFLVDTDWGAIDYHLLATSRQDVLKKLDSVPVGYVAIHDMGRPGLPHHALLRDALLSAPEHWKVSKVLQNVSVPGVNETLTIYVNSDNLAKAVANFDLDMRRKLGRVIVLQSPDE